MKEDYFEDIIEKFLDGAATAQEKRMLSEWLKENPEGLEMFYHQISNREMARPQNMPKLDTKIAAYEMFLRGEMPRSEMVNREGVTPPRFVRTKVIYYQWAAAISFLFVIGLYLLSDVLLYKTFHSEAGTIRSVSLQDGSLITLNANSLLKVPRNFSMGGTREVWIEGEAFFEITRKEDHAKFIVHTKDVVVQVLGTKFNVNNRDGETHVTLDEGKVKLISKDNRVLMMKPGDQVSVSKSGLEIKKKVVDPETYTAWQGNRLFFENTPLSEVARIIGDYYGLTVVLDDVELADRQFTGTLPNNDLSVILLALATAYNIDIERQGERILIRK